MPLSSQGKNGFHLTRKRVGFRHKFITNTDKIVNEKLGMEDCMWYNME